MKKELPYFSIGDSFGGNQDWFRDPMMHLGGFRWLSFYELWETGYKRKGGMVLLREPEE